MISAKVTPFAPPLNGHCKEIWTVTGLSDLGAAYANVIGLLLKGFRGKRHLILPLISSYVILKLSDMIVTISNVIVSLSDVIAKPSDVSIENTSVK
jgi:hypothetical protein